MLMATVGQVSVLHVAVFVVTRDSLSARLLPCCDYLHKKLEGAARPSKSAGRHRFCCKRWTVARCVELVIACRHRACLTLGKDSHHIRYWLEHAYQLIWQRQVENNTMCVLPLSAFCSAATAARFSARALAIARLWAEASRSCWRCCAAPALPAAMETCMAMTASRKVWHGDLFWLTAMYTMFMSVRHFLAGLPLH